MRDLTHTHDEDPEEHKGRFLDADEIVDPDFEGEDNGITSVDESSDASTD